MRCAPAAALDATPLTASFASTADSIRLGMSLCVHNSVDSVMTCVCPIIRIVS